MRFLAACRGEQTDAVPVWFMRQAGRSLPEYRALRSRYDILELCRTPELAAEVTVQPVKRLGVDAAILFSDIVLPLQAMGAELEIRPGIGPVIADPVRDSAGVGRLRPLEPEAGLPFVLHAIRLLLSELDVPLIGFAGAPFTLASYLIEGGPSKNHARTKALMYGEPQTWTRLMNLLADATLRYLRAQVAAGVQAVQIFDSWVGHLSASDYAFFAEPYVERIVTGLAGFEVPRIVFGVGTGELLASMADTGVEVVGVDWRVGIDDARARTNNSVVLQGNLDPAVCLAPWEVVRSRCIDVLDRGGGHKHIFNLGHGVLPETDPDVLARIVELVHNWRVHD